MELDFNNTAEAFKHKTNEELKKTLWLFKLLNHPVLGPLGKGFLKVGLKIGLPVKPLIKATLYKYFVGGETLEDCIPLLERLAKSNVKSILDYSAEARTADEELEHAFQELLKSVRFAAGHKEVPLAVFKPTAIIPAALLTKISEKQNLTEEEKIQWEKARYRFDTLCNTAFFSNVPIMIDAEDSWYQQAIDDLVLEMMEKYNKTRPVVINTYQLYRKDRLEYLKENFDYARSKDFFFGAKLVRGAYMEKERKRAAEKGYPSPIHDTKADTDQAFDDAVRFCMQHLDRLLLVIATHNEESNRLGAVLIHGTPYKKDHPYLWFSQLLGMCDHISYTLAAEGYNVAKYMPYGPVAAVTPYLIRRADENSSVAGQAKKEMLLLKAELSNRKKKKAGNPHVPLSLKENKHVAAPQKVGKSA